MYIFLDPRNENNMITVGIWNGKSKPHFFVYDRNKNRSLLAFIIKELQAISPKKLKSYPIGQPSAAYGASKLQAIQGIVIVPGPGGFSTVRGAAVLANTFVFAASTPLITVKPRFEESSKDIFRRGIKLLRSGKLVTYVEPHYGKEPNINKG